MAAASCCYCGSILPTIPSSLYAQTEEARSPKQSPNQDGSLNHGLSSIGQQHHHPPNPPRRPHHRRRPLRPSSRRPPPRNNPFSPLHRRRTSPLPLAAQTLRSKQYEEPPNRSSKTSYIPILLRIGFFSTTTTTNLQARPPRPRRRRVQLANPLARPLRRFQDLSFEESHVLPPRPRRSGFSPCVRAR